jgi:ABC-type multidrug transport system fused ATPase/permease subunit
VLSHLSFTIAPGEIVAIVGSTGAGKSSLCRLLVRLDEPDEGSIRIAGRDLREIDPDELRRAVALVFQEPFLFGDRIVDNITLGDEMDDVQVRDATAVARAEAFIDRLPEGLETITGERGVTLSGGQRQRVALARALAREPGLLVLDDATSAVDPTVEAEILAGLRASLDATTLIVAHRVSTIELADRVLFLSDGRLSGSGTHEELLSDPAYLAIVRAYEEAAA